MNHQRRVLITVCLCCCLSACGGSPSTASSEDDARTTVTTEPDPTPAPPAAPMYIKGEEICDLLSRDEVEEILGRPLTKPPQPSEALCAYWAKGSGVRIENPPRPSSKLKGYAGAALAKALAEWLASIGPQGTVIDGIADGAVQAPARDRHIVFVVRGPHLFSVQATGEITDETAAQLVAVASAIGPRLQRLDGHVR